MFTEALKIDDDVFAITGYGSYAFWENARPCLVKQGYTFFEIFEPSNFLLPCVPPFPLPESMVPPYAIHDHLTADEEPFHKGQTGRIMYAQDTEHRHVVLKLLRNNGSEHRVFKIILDKQASYPMNRIPGIVPLLDLIPYDGHWLAVMPRWGKDPFDPWFPSFDNVFTFIHTILRGLAFLHEERVVHRDLQWNNLLVNHVPNDHRVPTQSSVRNDMQKSRTIDYAWFDFGYSVVLPQMTPLESVKFPWKAAWFGTWEGPPDVAQGEYEYNPFAYDVGSVGRVLCDEFQHLTPLIPMLAPLLDGMVRRDVSSRFTAAQALDFFEQLRPTADLEGCPPPPPGTSHDEYASYESYDRWAGLPDQFIRQWGHLREAPVPRSTRILRWMCRRVWLASVIRGFRYIWKYTQCVIPQRS